MGISIDYPRALEYFGKAASKGHVEAAGKLNLPVTVLSSSAPSLALPENNNKKLQVSLMQQQQKQERCYIM